MIHIFNRKEVYMGQSVSRFSEVREILRQNNIKYKYKVIDNAKSRTRGRSGLGSFGEKGEYRYTYYVYVHKEDLERAKGVMRGL